MFVELTVSARYVIPCVGNLPKVIRAIYILQLKVQISFGTISSEFCLHVFHMTYETSKMLSVCGCGSVLPGETSGRA